MWSESGKRWRRRIRFLRRMFLCVYKILQHNYYHAVYWTSTLNSVHQCHISSYTVVRKQITHMIERDWGEQGEHVGLRDRERICGMEKTEYTGWSLTSQQTLWVGPDKPEDIMGGA